MEDKEKIDSKTVKLHRRTPGEKAYDVINFTFSKAFIMVLTAGAAYYARYGKENNALRKFQDWFEKSLLKNPVLPLAEKGEVGKRLAAAAASTTTIMHGGNLFAPFLQWMENNRDNITHYYNQHFGEAEDVAIGDARTKDLPKQNWKDTLKGRVGSWLLVFTSFAALDAGFGKDKHGRYQFDKYEDWFGRKLAEATKEGFPKVPLREALPEAAQKVKRYRLGKIIALDIYATTAAILLWNSISRGSAKKRAQQEKKELAQAVPAPIEPMQQERDCGSCKTTHAKHDIAAKSQEGFEAMVGKETVNPTPSLG